VKHIKHFLEANDVTINQTKFKMKIKLPREIKREKEGITKDQVREMLAACDDIRLKTYVMFLASTGWRASEALSVQLQDIDFDRNPVSLFALRIPRVPALETAATSSGVVKPPAIPAWIIG
jgi:integrase